MTLEEYILSLKDKRVAVAGLGISNRPLVKLLLDAGCDVTVCDRREREQLGAEASELESAGAALKLGGSYLDGLNADVIFRSPSLLPRKLKDAARSGAAITSEMEAFFSLCPCRIMAVTGSDGKTTTTTLISELLKAAGYTVHLGGNIGTPLLDRLPDIRPEDFAVLELSSFQLHSMSCRPDVAVITNLSPNHLDIHSSYEDYADAKKNIFRLQGPDCRLVLNADCEATRAFADEARSETRFFSRRETLSDGVFLGAGMIYFAKSWNIEAIVAADDIRLPGVHNVENFMAACAAVQGLVPRELCRKVAMEFPGVEHRLELVREKDGVRYYNDSIASSPSRAVAGLRCFPEKVVIVAGGKDKGIPFDEFGREICRHVKTLVLTGATAEAIRSAVLSCEGEKPEIIMRPDFDDAVKAASDAASAGDVVILSPGCTSFDRFANFEERGKYFKRLVNEL